MRISLLLSLVIIAITWTGARGEDRITYAIGGPAHRSVDTIDYVPMERRTATLGFMRGVLSRESATEQKIAEPIGIAATRPFLREPGSKESLFKHGEALFLHFPPSEAHELPKSIEAPPTGSPFDGMPLATR